MSRTPGFSTHHSLVQLFRVPRIWIKYRYMSDSTRLHFLQWTPLSLWNKTISQKSNILKRKVNYLLITIFICTEARWRIWTEAPLPKWIEKGKVNCQIFSFKGVKFVFILVLKHLSFLFRFFFSGCPTELILFCEVTTSRSQVWTVDDETQPFTLFGCCKLIVS